MLILCLFYRVLFVVVVDFGTRGRTNPRLDPCHNSHRGWVGMISDTLTVAIDSSCCYSMAGSVGVLHLVDFLV
jgi:hypothetical protein